MMLSHYLEGSTDLQKKCSYSCGERCLINNCKANFDNDCFAFISIQRKEGLERESVGLPSHYLDLKLTGAKKR